MKKRKSIRAGEWFGLGKTISEESWNNFLKAHREYWAKIDAGLTKEQIRNERKPTNT